ncbi:MAG TPA: serine/threonine-protein kinase, partial [Polyangia bacterium]|nr:serine/threonine-protein kinase [Polyangia bacterium]
MPRETTGAGADQAQPVLFGKYELVQRLGNGGMAEVWRARIKGPAGFSRSLVIKRILPHLAQDNSFVDMFISEAQLSAKLSHPNIIQVFELGEVDGEYYIAMEYVRGRDLQSFARGHLAERGPVPPVVTAYVMREVCGALGYAHEFRDEDGNLVRLIHRDVSPSNVMISNDGSVKLLDFGIAKALAESGDRTQTGTLKGKFAYMAPEQLEGNDFDHRADIFAAGIILHETLVGKRLFRGNNDLKTIALVKSANVVPPSQLNPAVPPELDRIALKALARDPDQRYQSASQMATDLDEVVHQLKGGPQLVVKLVNELFVNEPSRPAVRLAAVPVDLDSGSGNAVATSVSRPVKAPSAVEGAATGVEFSASYTGVLQPLPAEPSAARV